MRGSRGRHARIGWALGAVAVVGAVLAPSGVAGAAGGADGDTVREVPQEYPTIQKAVNAAKPGDLVLVSPGVYREAVTVDKDDIVIRGRNRARTILDGEFKRQNGIQVLDAKGGAIENLTARNYKVNGFYWSGVDGYRGSYLTAIRNGDYGIYAFESTNGVFEHSYGSGSPDAGFYIGGCYPCNAVIDDVISEWNGIGYSGTNAGGDLYIVNSVFRDNRVGVVPNVGTYEPCFPQREVTVVGNRVYSNNNGKSDAIDVAQTALGNGILIAGGIGNVVERNRVWDHDITGIGIVPLPEDDPRPVASDELNECEDAAAVPASVLDIPTPDLPATVLWPSQNNRIVDNAIDSSRLADLGLADLGTSPTPDGGNCFSGNEAATTAPIDLQTLAPCGAPPATAGWDNGPLDVNALIGRDKPPVVNYKKVKLPKPGKQPEMPNAAKAPANPQTGPPTYPDVSTIALPARG
jgi:hypothetical protein